MEFKNKKVMQIILNNLPIIGQGSQGICYYNKKDEVYKIFHQAFEDDDFINYKVIEELTDEKDELEYRYLEIVDILERDKKL